MHLTCSKNCQLVCLTSSYVEDADLLQLRLVHLLKLFYAGVIAHAVILNIHTSVQRFVISRGIVIYNKN